MNRPATDAPLRFGSFELQRHERRLLVDGRVATLGARAFDVLVALAERPGRLVGKTTLMDLVWPGLVVQENNLAAQVSALRKLLGDGVIATIPGRGYRFVARLAAQPAGDGAPAPVSAAAPAVPALRTNLPVELPALLGRADELAGARRARRAPPARQRGRPWRRGQVAADAASAGDASWTPTRTASAGSSSRGVADAQALPGAVAAALGVDVRLGRRNRQRWWLRWNR